MEQNDNRPAETQQRDVLNPATTEERQALTGHLRGMADAIADGTLPFDGYTSARMQYDLHVRDFTSRDAALAAFEALAARLGVEVVHSDDRHQATRTWVDARYRWLTAEYTAILWEDRDDDEAAEEDTVEAATTAVDEPAFVAEPVEESEPVPAADEDASDTERRLARVSSAVGGLVRLREGGHLKNLRAGECIDAITAALDGHASPSALVAVEDDTVYVSDGVVMSTFSMSEAYTLLHALVDGLPNARRSLGIETAGAL